MRSSRKVLAFVIPSFVLAAWNTPSVIPADSPLAPAESPLVALAGTWQGTADVGVNWTSQRTLAVELTIDSRQRVRGRVNEGELSVRGRVGDAELTHATLRENAGLVMRKIARRSELIVQGYLKGPVIAAEEVQRGGVTISLDQRDGQLVGSLHTTGSAASGPLQAPVTAGPFLLRRK
jgi:hypothetical protein